MTQTTATNGSSMWDPFEKGEPLETLVEAGRFVLLDGRVRTGIKTEHGERDACDLYVSTTEDGVVRIFSGFAAGIVGQLKRKGEGDLPAVVTIVEHDTGKGNPTKALELIAKLEEGASASSIAASLPVPMRPIENAVPY